MIRFSAHIALLASGLMIVFTGCTIPTGQPDSGFRMPGSPRTPSIPSPPSSPLPGSGSFSPIPGYSQSQAAPDPSVAQVGFFAPACDSSAAGTGCGCLGCGAADCSVTPHGYVMQSPAGWNAYGTDPQEFICDGGDQQPAAFVRRDDSVGGLAPQDTIVHYTNEAGEIEVQASNRTCLYAPRFSSVRKITGALAGGRAVSLAQVDRPQGANRIDIQIPGLTITDSTELGHADVARPIDAMRERIRGVPVEAVLQPVQTGDVIEAMAALSLAELRQLRDDQQALFEQLALAAVTWELDESLEVVIEDLKAPVLTRDEQLQGFTIYEFPDAGRLQISKLADRTDAQPGEIVSFAIRVENVGDSAVNHVVLMDNLVTRLEYVEGSQTCSGGAEFEALENESQSMKLQWKLTDKLRVGESVTIRFQCKVR